MTKQTLEKANEIVRILQAINKTQGIMRYPYPTLYHEREEVCFVAFDKQTLGELRTAIEEVLDRRKKDLEKELEEL